MFQNVRLRLLDRLFALIIFHVVRAVLCAVEVSSRLLEPGNRLVEPVVHFVVRLRPNLYRETRFQFGVAKDGVPIDARLRERLPDGVLH